MTYGSQYGTLPTPTKTGYTFEGWYTAASGGSKVTSSTTMGASNTTIYAHWSGPNTYTLTYNANGGSVSPSSKNVTYGSQYGALPTPTRTGYSFVAWYTTASGGSKVTASTTMGASNTTIYAHWSGPNSYTLTYNANGGNVSPSSKTVSYGSTYGDMPTPTRTGYTFDGWFTAASGGTQITSSTKVTTTSAQTLYAHWTANTYTVAFNANGGSGTMSSQTFTCGVSQNLSKNAFTKANSVFAGWSTSSGSSTVRYSDMESVKDLTSSGGTITLYAVWETVSFSSSGMTLTRTPTGLTLSKSSLTLATVKTSDYLQTDTLTSNISGYTSPTGTISYNSNTTLTWTSSNTSVATVSTSGVVTAKSPGTATITATTPKGAKATCTVTVNNGENSITWTSSDSSVAAVSNGSVSAKKKGTATITAKTTNGKTATCSVKVGMTYKAVRLTSSSTYASISEGLYLYNKNSIPEFECTFVTGNSVDTINLYQCQNGANSGALTRIAVTLRYSTKAYTQTSDYTLSPNTKYTVVVTTSATNSAPVSGKIIIKDENGNTLSTKNCSWEALGAGQNKTAYLGPHSSALNGSAFDIRIISMTVKGCHANSDYKYTTMSFDFSAGSIGDTVFTSGSIKATFTGTSLQQYVLFPN